MFLKLRLMVFKMAVKISNHPSIKELYFKGSPTLKQVAITFDDGPDDVFTPQILAVLKQYEVKATFFLVGKMALKYPDVVKQIASEGHVIANHTWSHSRMFDLNSEQIGKEVTSTEDILFKTIGVHTTLFRPPYGIITLPMLKALNKLGYKTVFCSVDTRDWAGICVSEIVDNVRKNIRPGGIVLQHSASHEGIDVSNTIHALPEILELLQNKGYTVVTVPQLLGL